MLIAAAHQSSSPLAGLVVVVVLVLASRPIIAWVAEKEGSPWLVRILIISLALHLAAAPTQIFLVDHVYHGIADFTRYDTQGSLLAPNFRSLHFTLAGADVRGIVNDGSVSIFTGVVMAFVGTSQLATFLVFAWLSYLGTICFYRAFTTTFPGVGLGSRRYARLVFFLPSTIYWTADSSKEAIMTVSLGLVALGCAKVLVRAPGGFRIATLGLAAGALIRPNELMVILGGFAVALMVRPQGERERMGTVKRIGGLLFMGILLGISVFLTVHYLRLGNATSGKFSLQATNQNNNETGTGFGSSGFVYSSSLAKWPVDLYEVLFNPLPFNAHGTSEYLAAIENTVIVGVIIASYRQLRILPRTAFARPYVMMCLVYSAGFVYAFAALGNLGLIYRERVMLLPFLMVLFAIPRTPKGRPPMYEWEYRRKDRPRLRAALLQRERMLQEMKLAYANRRLAGASGVATVGADAGAGVVDGTAPGDGPTDGGPSPGEGGASSPPSG
jgi:hypothetical protein